MDLESAVTWQKKKTPLTTFGGFGECTPTYVSKFQGQTRKTGPRIAISRITSNIAIDLKLHAE